MFEQLPDGIVCGEERAKLRSTALIWSKETWVRKTWSKANIERKWPEPAPKPMITTIKKVSELRYASDTISDEFWDGKSLRGLVDDITSYTINLSTHEKMILDCVEVPVRRFSKERQWDQWVGSEAGCQGTIYCLNNRRLWCIKESSEKMGRDLPVRVKIYRFSDCAEFWQSRITTVNGGHRVSIRRLQEDSDLPTGDMPERMYIAKSKRKSEYLHLIVDGFHVDVLASCTPTLCGERLADALLN